MRSLVYLGVLACFTPVLADGNPVRRDPIPSGRNWSCFVGETQSYCRRTKVECDDFRTQYMDQFPSETPGACTPQKLAAVVTFKVVLKDVVKFIATPTVAGCKKVRANLLEQGDDMSNVSPCTNVGERKSVLHRRVPKGSGFYCQATIAFTKSIGGLYADSCHRELSACMAAVENVRKYDKPEDPVDVVLDCERQDAAYAITATDGSINLMPKWCATCDLVW